MKIVTQDKRPIPEVAAQSVVHSYPAPEHLLVRGTDFLHWTFCSAEQKEAKYHDTQTQKVGWRQGDPVGTLDLRVQGTERSSGLGSNACQYEPGHSYTESLSPAIQRECGQPDGKVFVRILKSHNSGESNHRTPQTELSQTLPVPKKPAVSLFLFNGAASSVKKEAETHDKTTDTQPALVAGTGSAFASDSFDDRSEYGVYVPQQKELYSDCSSSSAARSLISNTPQHTSHYSRSNASLNPQYRRPDPYRGVPLYPFTPAQSGARTIEKASTLCSGKSNNRRQYYGS